MPSFNSYLPKVGMKLSGIKYGKSMKLRGWPFIYKSRGAKMEIGEHVTCNSNFFSNLVGLHQRTIIVAKKQGHIKIGNRVGISGATIYGWKSIEIGDDTRIGANCKIVDTDFHPVDPVQRLNGINEAAGCKPVKIGKNCFIGMNSLILKGTVLGDNCVVGAGSVVCGQFEAGSILAGNPARVIRKIEIDQEGTKGNV